MHLRSERQRASQAVTRPRSGMTRMIIPPTTAERAAPPLAVLRRRPSTSGPKRVGGPLIAWRVKEPNEVCHAP